MKKFVGVALDNFKSLEEFLNASFRDFWKLPFCGKKTAKELYRLKLSHAEKNGVLAGPTSHENFSVSLAEHSTSLLSPLSNKTDKDSSKKLLKNKYFKFKKKWDRVPTMKELGIESTCDLRKVVNSYGGYTQYILLAEGITRDDLLTEYKGIKAKHDDLPPYKLLEEFGQYPTWIYGRCFGNLKKFVEATQSCATKSKIEVSTEPETTSGNYKQAPDWVRLNSEQTPDLLMLNSIVELVAKNDIPRTTFVLKYHKELSVSNNFLYNLIDELIDFGMFDCNTGSLHVSHGKDTKKLIANFLQKDTNKSETISVIQQGTDKEIKKVAKIVKTAHRNSERQSSHPKEEVSESVNENWQDIAISFGLSVRATNVLINNFNSAEKFSISSYKQLLKLQFCGRKTADELYDFKVDYVGSDETFEKPTLYKILSASPDEQSIVLLPLFCRKNREQIQLGDLHADFPTSMKLSDLVFSTRTANVLDNLGIETIGDVLLTSGAYLLQQKNFGRNCLQELRNVVRSICLGDNEEDDSYHIDYSSYDEMMITYIGRCVKKERDQKLLLQRLCFSDGKVPTLEPLGQQFEITRERARQILKKGMAKLRVKVNIDKLDFFWRKLDQLVAQGGGLIRLETLSTVLQNEFDWPIAPYPLALGQFLLLKQPDATFKKAGDLFEVECNCLSCDIPGHLLKSLNFDSNESFHVQVVAAKIIESCQIKCPWDNPVTTFHPALIELLVYKSNGLLILHDDVVLPHDRWLGKYSKNLEDVACHVLETHGEPMHFREIANGIRRENKTLFEITDRHVHNAIMRYKKIEIIGRGTYGLKSWGLGGYRSVSTAIEELVSEKGSPQRRQYIIQHLAGEFSEQNITTALTKETRFTSIGDGFYDLPQNWKQLSCQRLIEQLPGSVAELAHFLVSRNNTSYRLVMAFIFIRSMDGDGTIYLSNLKKMFYNFYLSRHKNGLIVELDTAVMSHIDEFSSGEFKGKVCKEPLKSLLQTEYFQEYSQNGFKARLVGSINTELKKKVTRDALLITFLKAIDDYFLEIVLAANVHAPVDITHNEVAEPQQESQYSQSEDEIEQPAATITIKKKGRGKIRL